MKQALLLSIVVLVLCLIAEPAHSGMRPGQGLFNASVGRTLAKSAYSGEEIDGSMIMFSYESLQNSQWSFGIAGGYSVSDDELGSGDTAIKYSISTIPLYLGGRYWIGNPMGSFQGYVGVGFGMYFTTFERSAVLPQIESVSWNTTGAGMSVPVGISVFAGDTLVISLGYSLQWLWTNEALENDLVHAVVLGLGFKTGKK